MGLTGFQVESDLLPPVNNSAESELVKTRYANNPKYRLNVNDAMDIVRQIQRHDPTNPDKKFLKDIREKIAGRFQLEDPNSLKIYCSIGTTLDRMGVDFFIDLELGNGKKITVTADITKNPSKDAHKADAILLIPRDGLDPDMPEDKEIYEEKIEEYAQELVRCFQYKIEKFLEKQAA